VPPGETFTVDSGHIVAFEANMEYDLKRVGGLKSTMFSGEGLVSTFRCRVQIDQPTALVSDQHRVIHRCKGPVRRFNQAQVEGEKFHADGPNDDQEYEDDRDPETDECPAAGRKLLTSILEAEPDPDQWYRLRGREEEHEDERLSHRPRIQTAQNRPGGKRTEEEGGDETGSKEGDFASRDADSNAEFRQRSDESPLSADSLVSPFGMLLVHKHHRFK